MKIKVLSKSKNELKIEIEGAGHSLCNLLQKMLLEEKNKDIVKKTIEAINTHDLSSIENIVATDFVDHTRQVRGLENLKQFLSMISKVFRIGT